MVALWGMGYGQMMDDGMGGKRTYLALILKLLRRLTEHGACMVDGGARSAQAKKRWECQ